MFYNIKVYGYCQRDSGKDFPPETVPWLGSADNRLLDLLILGTILLCRTHGNPFYIKLNYIALW